MLEYAGQRGLRRLLVPVPFLSPRLSSLWLALVTPVYAGIGRRLVESLRNERWSTTRARSTTSRAPARRSPRRSPARS